MKVLGGWKRKGDEIVEYGERGGERDRERERVCVRVREREREMWTDDRFVHITHAGRTVVGMG